MPNVWVIIALCVAIVSFILAVIGHEVANPLYLIMLAIFIVLFTGAKSPW